jgi:hypothetical protein
LAQVQVPLEQARLLLGQQLLEHFLVTTMAVEEAYQQFLLELQVAEKQEHQVEAEVQSPRPPPRH